MCLAKAYLNVIEGNNLILEDVAMLRAEGEKLYLSNLFGEQKEVEGIVKEVDFQKASIVLQTAG